MPYMLDTNVAIHVRDGDEAIMSRVEGLDDTIMISIVTRVELEGGIATDPARAVIRWLRLDEMLQSFSPAPFDDASADAYRTILQASGYSRRKLLDRMIAAQALAHGASLVTMNTADFDDVPGLNVVEW